MKDTFRVSDHPDFIFKLSRAPIPQTIEVIRINGLRKPLGERIKVDSSRINTATWSVWLAGLVDHDDIIHIEYQPYYEDVYVSPLVRANDLNVGAHGFKGDNRINMAAHTIRSMSDIEREEVFNEGYARALKDWQPELRKLFTQARGKVGTSYSKEYLDEVETLFFEFLNNPPKWAVLPTNYK